MSPHDSFELPARTMLTSEASINRSTHLLFENDKYRFITPNILSYYKIFQWIGLNIKSMKKQMKYLRFLIE